MYFQFSERIYLMVKKWHDVVSNCGENPKELLAAAIQACGNFFIACEYFGNQFAKGNKKNQLSFQFLAHKY